MKEKLMKLFLSMMHFGKMETANGTLIYEADTIEVGTEVFVEDAEGNIVSAPDGEYDKYVVVDGKVTEIKEETEEPADEPIVEAEEEAPVVEEPASDEPDEKDKKIAELEAKIAELEAIIAEYKAKEEEAFAALKPAEEEIKDVATKSKDNGALKYFN